MDTIKEFHMISQEFKEKLDETFIISEQNNDLGSFQPSQDTAIIPNGRMEEMIASGEASTSIKTPTEYIEHSDFLRQVGNYIYVKWEDPTAEDENDEIKWVIYKSKDHTNGKKSQEYKL